MIRLIILVVSLVALAIALGIGLTGPGTKAGWWDYGTGLGYLRTLAMPAMVAAGASALALILSVIKARGFAPLALIALVASGAAASVPLQMRALVEANPFIHDITTDFENPPTIVKGADAPRKNPAEYDAEAEVPRRDDGKRLAAVQMEAFPDIQPLIVDATMDEAVEATRTALGAMKLEVIAEGPVSDETGSGWRIEAIETSKWYGFIDDFVVRITPTADGKQRIDLRSKSRVGASDLGVNAKRVRTFSEKLTAAL